jgi:hypothetical protein
MVRQNGTKWAPVGGASHLLKLTILERPQSIGSGTATTELLMDWLLPYFNNIERAENGGYARV